MVSCSKPTSSGYFSCSGPSPADDSTQLLGFAKNNSITPIKDTSFLFYQILSQGTGITPVGTSKITVTYVGKLMDGTIIDSTGTTPRTFELDSLITGWQYGLKKIQAGGEIKLLIPSALAFGCNGTSGIAPNSPLYFDVQLLGVK